MVVGLVSPAPGLTGNGRRLTSRGPSCRGPETVLVASLITEAAFSLCLLFSTGFSSLGLMS